MDEEDGARHGTSLQRAGVGEAKLAANQIADPDALGTVHRCSARASARRSWRQTRSPTPMRSARYIMQPVRRYCTVTPGTGPRASRSNRMLGGCSRFVGIARSPREPGPEPVGRTGCSADAAGSSVNGMLSSLRVPRYAQAAFDLPPSDVAARTACCHLCGFQDTRRRLSTYLRPTWQHERHAVILSWPWPVPAGCVRPFMPVLPVHQKLQS